MACFLITYEIAVPTSVSVAPRPVPSELYELGPMIGGAGAQALLGTRRGHQLVARNQLAAALACELPELR